MAERNLEKIAEVLNGKVIGIREAFRKLAEWGTGGKKVFVKISVQEGFEVKLRGVINEMGEVPGKDGLWLIVKNEGWRSFEDETTDITINLTEAGFVWAPGEAGEVAEEFIFIFTGSEEFGGLLSVTQVKQSFVGLREM